MTIKTPCILRCTRAVALLEFALVLPVLLMIVLGIVEMGRYAIISMKLDKTANSMADFVTQSSIPSFAGMDSFATQAAPQIMRPYMFSGSIIFSSVSVFNNPTPPCVDTHIPCVAWHYEPVGNDISHIGGVGVSAVLPEGYEVAPGQDVIVSEIFFDYMPLLNATAYFIPSLAAHSIYKIAIYKPRQGRYTSPPV